ncbi:hypothetical protein Y032_0246g12 [Ancylostoma ceylanicum]|uniref:Uncharacterized protein n=1 Tax=Ancylostoma ceylanicum TaxID=53326 RepID=A0A016SCT2_9BILA|nr:hypothetical protein Y032_0246g12 [Ancylostoma ceylanicum]
MELIARTLEDVPQMWVIAKIKVKMSIDCHAPLIITPLPSEVSSFTLSMWRSLRQPAVGAIATIAGKVWGYSKTAAVLLEEYGT